MNRLPIAVCVTAALALAPLPALAGGTQKIRVSEYKDLDRGETEGAAIESSGRVTVGFLPQKGEVKATTAFTCLSRSKSVLVGTADKAAIFEVFPNNSTKAGKATRPKDGKKAKPVDMKATLKVKKLAELDGVMVSAMTSLPGGDILAATLPGGKIVRVSSRGKVKPFAALKVSQIWALVVHKGRLLVGTGPKGELWSLSLKGKDPKVVLDAEEKDILSIATVGDAIVAGVSPRAKIYQVTDKVEGQILHSFSGADEVRSMALTKTGLVAAVNAFEDRKLTSLDALTKTLNRTSLTGQAPAGNLSSERAPQAAASLYSVDLGPKRDLARALEAPWEKWLARDKQYFTSLAATEDGKSVLVASSASGKVYRARGPRDVATVGDFEERQTTSLCRVPKGPVFATVAHGAGVYQLRGAAAAGAKYRTEVFDAKQPASYGAIVLRGSGLLSLRARVGPTEEPDRQWSDWKKITLRKGADGLRGSLTSLPQRRHLELEVSLRSPSSELRSLELFYAPENLAPLLTAVDVDHPRFDGDDTKEPSSNVTIKWKVDARDNDDLVYDVRIRPEGSSDKEWIKVHDDDELVTSKELKLDLTTVPDGVYEVEVRASDEPTNGSANAKSDELVSAPFVVDRQRPEIAGISIKGRRITAKANDAGGYVHDVAYSIDAGPFRAASPADGLFDSPGEDLAIELPKLDKGKHRVVIRARDSFGNIGTAAIIVTF